MPQTRIAITPETSHPHNNLHCLLVKEQTRPRGQHRIEVNHRHADQYNTTMFELVHLIGHCFQKKIEVFWDPAFGSRMGACHSPNGMPAGCVNALSGMLLWVCLGRWPVGVGFRLIGLPGGRFRLGVVELRK